MDLGLGWDYSGILNHLLLFFLMALPFMLINKSISSINSKAKEINVILFIICGYFAILLFTTFTMLTYISINFLLQENPFSLFWLLCKKQPTFLFFRLMLLLFSIYVTRDLAFFIKKILMQNQKIREKKINLHFKKLCKNVVLFFFLLALNVYYIKNTEYSQLIGGLLFLFEFLSRFSPKKNKTFENFTMVLTFAFTVIISVLLVNLKLTILITALSFISFYMFFTVNFNNTVNKHRLNWI